MEAKLEFKKKIKGTQKIVPLIVGAAEEVIEGKYNNGKFYPVVEDKTLSKEFSPKIGKIYLDVDTDKQYKWDGQQYKEVNDNNVYTKDETYSKQEVYNKSEVYNKLETYNKQTIDELIGTTKNISNVTYEELLTLKNNNNLTPGKFYRITDYENTTDITFDGLTSHQFDIILLALSHNELYEEGWATMNESNIYDVTFNNEVTKKCWLYCTSEADNKWNIVDCDTLLGLSGLVEGEDEDFILNEENKTITMIGIADTDLENENLTYNYFQNHNLPAWKIWYCIDNDRNRFSWAKEPEAESISIKFIHNVPGGFIGERIVTFTRNKSDDKQSVNILGGAQNITLYAWAQVMQNGEYSEPGMISIYTTTETPTTSDNIYTLTYSNNYSQQSNTIEEIKFSIPTGIIYRIEDETGDICKLTWEELKTIRDNNALVAGTKYRITDYQCTTTQENTQSAGHQFDIIVTALTESKLSEEASAVMHENIYDVTFSDGVTKKCYLCPIDGINGNVVDAETLLGFNGVDMSSEITINEESKTAQFGEGVLESTDLLTPNLTYNYFQNSNLSAWKLWYCLDNDIARFGWTGRDETVALNLILSNSDVSSATYIRDKSNDMIGRINGEQSDITLYTWSYFNGYWRRVYTTVESPTTSDTLYVSAYSNVVFASTNHAFGSVQTERVQSEGKGIIYRMIDEWGNDCPYDFKNIQFKRKLTDGAYDESNGTDTWVYTFNCYFDGNHYDFTIFDIDKVVDVNFVISAKNNTIKNSSNYGEIDISDTRRTMVTKLPNVVFLENDQVDYPFVINNFISDSYNITIDTQAVTRALIMRNCNDCTILQANNTLISCSSYTVTNMFGIYFNNTKLNQ